MTFVTRPIVAQFVYDTVLQRKYRLKDHYPVCNPVAQKNHNVTLQSMHSTASFDLQGHSRLNKAAEVGVRHVQRMNIKGTFLLVPMPVPVFISTPCDPRPARLVAIDVGIAGTAGIASADVTPVEKLLSVASHMAARRDDWIEAAKTQATVARRVGEWSETHSNQESQPARAERQAALQAQMHAIKRSAHLVRLNRAMAQRRRPMRYRFLSPLAAPAPRAANPSDGARPEALHCLSFSSL